MVVLDIGGDIGALVISAPASLAGAEIEICPSRTGRSEPDEGTRWWHGPWRRQTQPHCHTNGHAHAWPHVAVVGRATGLGTQHCAVYPGLRRGRYDLWLRPDEPTALTVTVQGGLVAWADWPEQPARS